MVHAELLMFDTSLPVVLHGEEVLPQLDFNFQTFYTQAIHYLVKFRRYPMATKKAAVKAPVKKVAPKKAKTIKAPVKAPKKVVIKKAATKAY